MRFFYVFMILGLLLSACDSPLNHRVEEDGKGGQGSMALLQFKQSQMTVKYEWLQGPFSNVNKPSTLMVYIYKDGTLTSLGADQQINFFATMPSMGHPLDQPGYFEELAAGVYLNKDITFNMSEEWEMELWLQNMNGDIQEKVTWLEHL